MGEAVELQNVDFAYAQNGFSKSVLKNVSFSVGKGEFAGIMGKTGCGKTTLLLALNGIVPKLVKGSFQGKVLVEGKDVSQKSVQEMSTRIAYVFQDPNDQIFSLTAFEEVAFALKLRKLPPGGRAARIPAARPDHALARTKTKACNRNSDCDGHANNRFGRTNSKPRLRKRKARLRHPQKAQQARQDNNRGRTRPRIPLCKCFENTRA